MLVWSRRGRSTSEVGVSGLSHLLVIMGAISRSTAFRYALDPTPNQRRDLARYAGASRFAYNQCLRLVDDALDTRRADPATEVPWTPFSLVSAFNAWKHSAAAGRVFAVGTDGAAEVVATGLPWRSEVAAEVFEEAAVDLGRALAAFSDSRKGARKGQRVGFPRRKRKGRCRDSFRLRNRTKGDWSLIRVGDGYPRSVTLPRLGTLRVHDDTRPLRRLLRPDRRVGSAAGAAIDAPRARILFATVARHGDRWYVCLNVEASDLHPGRHHPTRSPVDHGGWVGLDRGLMAFVVAAAADGTEVLRLEAPKPLGRSLRHLVRLSRAASRKRPGSAHRSTAARRLSRHHARVVNIRRAFLHRSSARLVKTHDRLCLEWS